MKKIFIILILVISLLISCGCTADEDYIIHRDNDYNEWVSPDGVHYWTDYYGLAPRYDSNGNLVIDKE